MEAEGAADGPDAASTALSGPQSPLDAPMAPDGPILFLLDEFAALGRLEAVERAMGLMAGYGLQLWPILQDMSQLRALYGPGQHLRRQRRRAADLRGERSGDRRMAEPPAGRETIGSETWSHRPGDAPGVSLGTMGRELMTPSEIMQLPDHLQLLRLQGRPPVLAAKIRYYDDPAFAGLFDPDAAR